MSDVKKELNELAGEFQILHSRMEEVLKQLGNNLNVKNSKPAKVAKTSYSKSKKKHTDADKVVRLIKRYKKGVDVVTLRKKTGFDEKKISNIVFRASQKGRIKRVGRGLYAAIT
jgi:hypothetical protein